MLGWRVTVVDTRVRRATRERFTEADEILLCRAEEVAARVSLTENTAVVVMTHNYLDDTSLLRALLRSPVCYLGILGPRQRTLKLLEEIKTESAANSRYNTLLLSGFAALAMLLAASSSALAWVLSAVHAA